MAKPTATTESGGAKVLLLASLKTTTPDSASPAAPVISASGDATYGNVGWLGVATHGDGDTATAPGMGASAAVNGAGTSEAPIVLIGAKDNAGTKLARALRCDENGILIVRVEPALDLPLQTPGGAVSISNATETAISKVDASRFGYCQQIEAICTAAGTVAATWTLRDGAAGSTLLVLQQPVAVAVVGTRYVWSFPNPLKTNAINKAFTIQSSSASTGTWIFTVNGFRSTL
jgi:hypothetical protein